MRTGFIAATCLLGSAAFAGTTNWLTNGDFEEVDTPIFGHITGWGPNGGWADHATYGGGFEPLASNANFMFYSCSSGNPGGDESVGQEVAQTFQLGAEYTFSSMLNSGGAGGIARLQIGYFDDTGAFVEVVGGDYEPDQSWSFFSVSGMNTDANSVGRNVVARYFGSQVDKLDIWADNAVLIPAPGAVALLGLGGLIAGGRRR